MWLVEGAPNLASGRPRVCILNMPPPGLAADEAVRRRIFFREVWIVWHVRMLRTMSIAEGTPAGAERVVPAQGLSRSFACLGELRNCGSGRQHAAPASPRASPAELPKRTERGLSLAIAADLALQRVQGKTFD